MFLISVPESGMPPAKRKQADEPAFLEGPEAEVPSGSEDDDDDFPSSDEEEEGESEGEEGDSEGAEDDADGNFGLSDGDEDPGQAGEGAGPAQNKPRNFLAGEKGDSFARAFAKLIGRAAGTDNDERVRASQNTSHFRPPLFLLPRSLTSVSAFMLSSNESQPAKKIRTADEEAATAAGASDSDNDSEGDRTEGGAGPSGQLPSLVPLLKAVHAGPILAGSRSLARRQQDVRKEGEAEREGRKMRAALKKRGHAVVTKKGEDLAADAAERALQKIATKGVVRLFNAVSKAQKAQREAQALGQVRRRRLRRCAFISSFSFFFPFILLGRGTK